MTTPSEHEHTDELNVDNPTTTTPEPSIDESADNQDESNSTDKHETRTGSTHEIEERNDINNDDDDATITDPGSTTTATDQIIEGSDVQPPSPAKESTVNNAENDHRSKRPFNSKVKYSAMSYHRAPFYTNGYSYGPAPYYFYPIAPSVNEKPTPLMVIPTPSSSTADNATAAESASSASAAVSPQNVPPRLRQASASESDSTVQQSCPRQPSPTTNGRRHRSILPRGSSHYYSPHPPPPLMATPPGVLFPYQPGHIAYNIRTPDELELLAFQQQMMNLPPSIIWPPPAYPPFPPYSMYGPSAASYNHSSLMTSPSSLLNPEAAEWVPVINGTEASSSENNILIDDEINFPPLNTSEAKPQVESSPDTTVNSKADDPANAITPAKVDAATTHPSSSQADQKPSTAVKATPVTYSTVILQAPDVNKSNKNLAANSKVQPRPQPLPTKDRTTKPQPPAPVRQQKENSSRRRPPPSNRNGNLPPARAAPPAEPPKPATQLTDDWIEVKSKKTKKFDRSLNDAQHENAFNVSPKLVSDEPMRKTSSPPSSLSSAGDHTAATYSSEDEEANDDDDDENEEDDENDDDDDLSDDELATVPEHQSVKTEYNQATVDSIHRRLDKGERLLILMRGCPGSGKSTLAKTLNRGYNGQILSTDGYYKDNNNLNEYLFEPSKHEDAHFYYNSRLASDAFKRNVSPIIIDNTNTRSWEMKPYVLMGKEAGYEILLVEPQTPWRYKAHELAKRNVHNLSLRRIQEMLALFEHNVTVQSISDQIRTAVQCPYQSSPGQEQTYTDTESIDPILPSKKAYDIIDDTNILDDVRLCINDMILFLTSNFYQTSQSLTSSASSFSDLSLMPSSPTTPSTPHSLLYRSLSRLSSTTAGPDHPFSNEHLLRLPTTPFSRCLESLTPASPANSGVLGKKRRKNKNKQASDQSDEMLFNSNNNNNNRLLAEEEDNYALQSTYNVCLPEECTGFVVIDEHDKNDCREQFTSHVQRPVERHRTLKKMYKTAMKDHSSTLPQQQQPASPNKKSQLLNIIHDGLTKPSNTAAARTTNSLKHVAVQCVANDLNKDVTDSDRILFGRVSTSSVVSTPISPPAGYIECGIQVDLHEHHIGSLETLLEFYAGRVSSETVKHFYDLCDADVSWARTQIEDYMQHSHTAFAIPTLRQLSLNALNRWDEQIKHTNPSFDTISIGDLLQGMNDDDAFDGLMLDKPPSPDVAPVAHSNQITIPWSMIHSLQELYGELPTKSSLPYDGDGILLPLDDELSMNVYQALQRLLGTSNQTSKPVNDKKVTKENKKVTKQPPQQPNPLRSKETKKSPNPKTTAPSLQDIMNEELNYIQTQKTQAKRQLDFASQHKLKELERHFPTMSPDVLYDIFVENESDFDLTLVCISSMLDETAPITTTPKPQTSPQPPSPPSTSSPSVRPPIPATQDLQSYETSRREALNHALKRKDCYSKADQANRNGMTGVASYYVNQALEQSRLMKEANRTAYEYLSAKRLAQFRQSHRLDLHELHADEALALFKQVEQELSEGNRRTTPKSIEVITGYGKNSPYGGGAGKIRSMILSYLRQKNYKYSEANKGAILVQF